MSSRKPKKKIPPSLPIDWEAVRSFRVILMNDKLPPRKLRIPKRPPRFEAGKLAVAEWSWSPFHARSCYFWFAKEINGVAVLWLGENHRKHCNVVALGIPGTNVPDRHSSGGGGHCGAEGGHGLDGRRVAGAGGEDSLEIHESLGGPSAVRFAEILVALGVSPRQFFPSRPAPPFSLLFPAKLNECQGMGMPACCYDSP
jgi:hypothetical protein